MENKLTKKMEKMEGKIDSLVNLVQRQEEQIQQQQQRFLQQLQDQQQQFLFQQQQQQQQQEQQQQQQPQKQLQRQQQQPQEQQQQLQETTSSPHQPSFSLMDPFITSAEVSSYLSILNNDKPAAALNPQKKIPCSNHLAKEIFHRIKDSFSRDTLLTSTLSGKGKFGLLDREKISLIKEQSLVKLGATTEDWYACQNRLSELLREYRKKLSKMT